MSSGENTVKIRLEIDFGDGSQAPVTITVGNPSEKARPVADQSVLPPGKGYTTPGSFASVKVQGSGTSGAICANGTEEEEPKPEQIALLIIPYGDPIPAAPPPYATFVTPDHSGFWQVNELGGAVCSWPGSGVTFPPNCLAIWKEFPTTAAWEPSSIVFGGICADHTDCGPEGIPMNRTTDQRLQPPVTSQVIDTVPRSWKVTVNGFRGSVVEEFIGTWDLIQFPQTAPGHLAWVTGGDSVLKPRVELFGQACGCGPFELRFSLNGTTVSYRFARDSWNPVGINQSTSVITSGLPEGSEIPGQVQVIPS